MQISFITVVAALVSLAQGTIMKPAAGDQWVVGEQSTIEWDTKSFSNKVDIALVPAGATDTSVIIAQIATQTANTGSYTWAPPSTMKGGDVSVIIVNSGQGSAAAAVSVSSKSSSVSEIFVIIISSGSKNNSHHGGKKNSTETAAGNITTIHSTATLTTHVTVPPNITTPQTSQPEAQTTPPPYAYGNTTTAGIAAGITASSTTLASVTGTGGGVPVQTFTGAASVLDVRRGKKMVGSGGFAAFIALLFL
ncbi:hypothetical protein ONS95_005262 [Cadophora gregata]|uniref:uncharacterized protein n=1 Tax=Cadophora gregata TaxID=51156 RepID=UPI0026DD3013|nr:uncharacterized protein ONS95_005262 [Cadophora gregata]KAK0103228.1 hypothetical protein ONS95_005262 [Cadophora gregata]